MLAKAVTIGRRTAGLVQNGMVTAVVAEIFLKSTGEILQSVREHSGAPKPSCQIRFFCAAKTCPHDLNHRSRRCLNGRTACAVFNDDAQRLRWSKRQRQTIFRLLRCQFGAMIGKTTNDLNPIEKMWSKVKSLLRSAEARTPTDLVQAIGQALAQVTPQDTLGWFASCGYSFC
jgi:hypothetical protein